ncbi:ATP-binding protein [Mucilaginibacter sp.]|uniref:ATP-binding protein n=1 Tax=Mucilaginibacter sp. TaxID=1882438 RepID=UPI0025D0C427|nr:ATP-binding protein [Mucilaginibacter sp.]
MCKFLISCFLLLSLFVLKSTAQSSSVGAYEIKTDTAYRLQLPLTNVQKLEDQSGKLTISQVSSPAMDAGFVQLTNKNRIIKKNVNVYWLRYRLKNMMARPVRVMMYANNGVVEFYMQQPGGTWLKQTTGRDAEWDKRNGYKQILAVYYDLQPGQESIFYKRSYVDNFNLAKLAGKSTLGATVGYFEPFLKARFPEDNKYLTTTNEMWLFGFMVLAGIITLIFYALIKDKLYLYFGIAAICFGFISENVSYDLFFSNSPILYRYLGNNLLQAIFIFAVWRFFDLYFEFRKNFPRLGKLMLGLTLLLTVLEYFTDIIPGLVSDTFGVVAISYVLLAIVIILVCLINRKTRSAKKILTVLPFMLACFFAFFNGVSNGIFKVSLSQQLVGQVTVACICWLVVSFLWTLLDRLMNTIKQTEAERTKLVQEQNLQLELKVEERTAALKASIDDLRTTQRQLIQSEKMASLGELTAGIAHEIQNPLNFINNFSEVSVELIAEMNDELKTGNITEGMEIAADIETNLQKINSHGKRADAIVKGMLQHSRQSSDKKEPTDINALCDEYLRLSYHGLRAKDKAFNAVLQTDFETGLPLINVVPQDIGRVMLNLFTNAFYSVTEKKKQGTKFEPKLNVTTKLTNGFIEITVRDNGIGIPQKIIDKIYQPFFTTKPTGQGTGLGLSLSYDIITKMHNGELLVDTKEGEFAQFIVRIPMTA